MKTIAWRGLALLLIPGCVLVQPLDEAKPDDDSNIPATSGNTGSSGGPSRAGSGNAGRSGSSGAASSAGAPSANGGAPSGVDFSLFTGTWTIVGGENTTTCEPGTTKTAPVETGGTTTFGLGTRSDLILDPGTTCEIWVDVDDRTGSLNASTSSCSYSDGSYAYYIEYDSYEFTVLGDGQTADANLTAYIELTDANDNAVYCHSYTTWNYER